MDARLLYQLLVAEMALNAGDAAGAFELILDAATRERDDALFKRAVDIALRARAGDRALEAARAWRNANANSMDALRLQLQVLLLLNRPEALSEPLTALLEKTPAADRPALINALPRFLQRASNPRLVAAMIEDALRPYRDADATRIPARVAAARAWLEAKDSDRALVQVREAIQADPSATGPVFLALELMASVPAAEQVVQDYLALPTADASVRLGYVRVLTSKRRYADAVAQLQIATQKQPEVAPPYLSLGALQLELKKPQEGEAALIRYVELVQQQAARTGAPEAASAVGAASAADAQAGTEPATASAEDSEADADGPSDSGLVQAWLMLAQSAEQRGDYKAAEQWLAKIDDPRRMLEVQTRRASILVRQGQVGPARELIRSVPERRASDGRAKLVAEAAVLREAQKWKEAYEVLAKANERFADDPDLLYEQAMMAEKTDRLDEMETLLKRVMTLQPKGPNAFNALGYSLADRRQRLPEARSLIQRALELAPGDPFITDSLGWAEFRLGNHEAALEHLRSAYAKRPDTEIAAHLGEVLWAVGQRDEARRIWSEGKVRDAANDVLRETLARLRVDL